MGTSNYSEEFKRDAVQQLILADNFIPHGHPATADHPTRPPLAHLMALHKVRDRLQFRGGRYH